MSFSRAQQPELREYLRLAWAAHCRHEGMDAEERCRGSRCGQCDYCAWYEDLLEVATGHRSTTACNAGRDYDFFMRDLEVVHGESIKWQLRAFRGDATRMLHEIAEVQEDHGLSERYLQGVARRMLGLPEDAPLPELHTLDDEVLISILGEVKRFVRRRLKRERVERGEGDAEGALF